MKFLMHPYPVIITLSANQIRDIAEGYAALAVAYYKLEQEKNPEKRRRIAESTIPLIEFYKKALPPQADPAPRQIVHPGMLEQTCRDILAGESE